MDMIDAPLTVEHPKGPLTPTAQPIGALSNLDTPLDDNAVRAALMKAEANNQDPMTATMADLQQVQAPQPAPAQPEAAQPKVEIPEKFLKPDGAVDVDKLQASTRQLDEAIAQKEQKLQEATKSVEDLFRHYKERETKFKTMPNPDKIVAQIQPQTPPVQQMPEQDLNSVIERDFRNDPLGTMLRLQQLQLERALSPIVEKENDQKVRENLANLAKNDPRLLQHYDKVVAKLDSDPDYWKLKNPHKAAWLEVKEELRLGEPSQVQAQPSRVQTPVLGGGTPPSTPSSTVSSPHANPISNLESLDLRDRKQEAMGDEAIRAFLAQRR